MRPASTRRQPPEANCSIAFSGRVGDTQHTRKITPRTQGQDSDLRLLPKPRGQKTGHHFAHGSIPAPDDQTLNSRTRTASRAMRAASSGPPGSLNFQARPSLRPSARATGLSRRPRMPDALPARGFRMASVVAGTPKQ